MTKLITLLIFILNVSAVNAQTKEKVIFVGNVISDTTSFENNDYRNRTGLESIQQSKNKIEIRFIYSLDPYVENYTILTYNKDWNAKYYFLSTDTFTYKDITQKTNLDTIFSWLVSNNIFSLPNQENLKTKTVKYEYYPETDEFFDWVFGVSGGVGYCIEFKVGNYYRRYKYSNPEPYADFYSQVQELRDFADIVKIFRELTEE